MRSAATRSSTAARTAIARSPSDRKSTRLNSSHLVISYAVFCLKKKKQHSYTSVVCKADSSAFSASLEKLHIDMESIDPSEHSHVDFFRSLLPHNQPTFTMTTRA